MAQLAEALTGLLRHKLKESLTEFDATGIMVVAKACRAVVNPMHVDNWDDGSGYNAIGAGIAEARKIEAIVSRAFPVRIKKKR